MHATTTTNHFNDFTLDSTSTERKNGRRLTVRRTPRAASVLYWTAAITPFGLAGLFLLVSLPHLSAGFQTICNCGPLAGWCLAAGFDLAQIVSKLQWTVSKKYALGAATKWTATAVICCTSVMSMALNVLGFLAGATDRTGMILSYTAGILIPMLVLALSYTGSTFVLAKVKRETKAKGRGSK